MTGATTVPLAAGGTAPGSTAPVAIGAGRFDPTCAERPAVATEPPALDEAALGVLGPLGSAPNLVIDLPAALTAAGAGDATASVLRVPGGVLVTARAGEPVGESMVARVDADGSVRWVRCFADTAFVRGQSGAPLADTAAIQFAERRAPVAGAVTRRRLARGRGCRAGAPRRDHHGRSGAVARSGHRDADRRGVHRRWHQRRDDRPRLRRTQRRRCELRPCGTAWLQHRRQLPPVVARRCRRRRDRRATVTPSSRTALPGARRGTWSTRPTAPPSRVRCGPIPATFTTECCAGASSSWVEVSGGVVARGDHGSVSIWYPAAAGVGTASVSLP